MIPFLLYQNTVQFIQEKLQGIKLAHISIRHSKFSSKTKNVTVCKDMTTLLTYWAAIMHYQPRNKSMQKTGIDLPCYIVKNMATCLSNYKVSSTVIHKRLQYSLLHQIRAIHMYLYAGIISVHIQRLHDHNLKL